LPILAGAALAIEVEATVTKVDADKGLLVFVTQNKERAVRVAKDAKILGADGKDLQDGLRSKNLAKGTVVTLTIEPDRGRPLIKGIALTKPAGEPPQPEKPRFDASKLVPLSDMAKDDKYQGFGGGLYPGGADTRPAAHEKAGLTLAKTIVPLDQDGQPSQDGKIVLMAIGFSNTVQAFKGFIDVAAQDKEINPHLVLVNGAVGGTPASEAQKEEGRAPKGIKYWEEVDRKLQAKGVSRKQVQVVWLKETNPAPHQGTFPGYSKTLEEQVARIVQLLPKRFPNVKVVYLSSRTWAGWAKLAGKNPKQKEPGNSEPYSYETGFAVKWLIEKQLRGDPALKFDGQDRKAPWLSWGPYLWANGEQPRKDGWSFQKSDFRADDQMHHSPQGMTKLGQALLRFFKTDTTTRTWFCKS